MGYIWGQVLSRDDEIKMRASGWPPIQYGWCPTRRGNEDTDTHRGKAVWEHREKTATYKLRREASEEANPEITSTLGF